MKDGIKCKIKILIQAVNPGGGRKISFLVYFLVIAHRVVPAGHAHKVLLRLYIVFTSDFLK